MSFQECAKCWWWGRGICTGGGYSDKCTNPSSPRHGHETSRWAGCGDGCPKPKRKPLEHILRDALDEAIATVGAFMDEQLVIKTK